MQDLGSPFNDLIITGQPGKKFPFSKKTLLIGAAVLVVLVVSVLVGVQFMNKGSGTVAQVVDISSKVAKITITDTGYSPSSIKISRGQQIMWTNQDGKPHRLLADQDVLPSFDSVDFLNKGDSYAYIFLDSGNYKYYDPDAPTKYVGNITVE